MEPIGLTLGLLAIGGGVATLVTARSRRRAAAAQSAHLQERVRHVRERYVDLEAARADRADDLVVLRSRLADHDQMTVDLDAAADADRAAFEAASVRLHRATSVELELPAMPDPWKRHLRLWQMAKDAVDGAVRASEALDRVVEAARGHLQGMPDTAGRVSALRASVMRALDRNADMGFPVDDLRAEVDVADALLDQGLADHSAGRVGAAAERMAAAHDTLTTVSTRAASYPAKLQALADEHARASDRLAAARPEVDRLVDTVIRLRERYAEVVWRSVSTTPETATAALQRIQRDLDAAGSALLARKVDPAADALSRAALALDAVETMCVGAAGLAAEVADAETRFPEALADARESLREAMAYTDAHTEEVSPVHAATLRQSKSGLAEASMLATADRPDPLRALTKVLEITDICDAILSQAQQDKSAITHQRVAARETLVAAKESIDSARRMAGLGVFGWSANAHATLDDMTTQWNRARDLVDSEPHRATATARVIISRAMAIATEASRRAK